MGEFDLKSSEAKDIPEKDDGLNENAAGSQFGKKYEKDSQKPSKLEAEKPRSQFGEKYEKDSQKPSKLETEEPSSCIERTYEWTYEEDSQKRRKLKAEEPSSCIERTYEQDSQKRRKLKVEEPSWHGGRVSLSLSEDGDDGLIEVCSKRVRSSTSRGAVLINEFKRPVKVVPFPQPKETVKQGDIPQPKGS